MKKLLQPLERFAPAIGVSCSSYWSKLLQGLEQKEQNELQNDMGLL